jgi:formylglycine-generating enzyme required for sulfatase activity
MREFDGKVPTVTGIRIDDETLATASKQVETRFQQNSFFVDYTLHRFTPLPFTGAADAGVSLTDVLRDYAILKADYEAIQKLVGTPQALAEAKANMERVAKQSAELQTRLAETEKALAAFERNAAASLAKVDQGTVAKLQKEITRLKRLVGGIDFAGSEAAFTGLEADERPPGLDCTGPSGANARTVRAAQVAWAKFLGEKSHEKTMALDKAGKVLMEMVLVPPGKYYRGSPAGKGSEDERPQKVITLTKAMWVGKYEVTQAQYMAVTGKANPSMFAKEGADAAKYPVEQVSHDDAVAFCAAATGGKFQLLTEAQWEYACRAGTRTEWYNGDDEKKVGEIAQFDGNNNKATAEVGSKTANAFGLNDMAGNVWEWCADWHGDKSYATSSEKDPTGAESGSHRVSRGGSWDGSAGSCRSACRGRGTPGYRGNFLGFRLAAVPSGQ